MLGWAVFVIAAATYLLTAEPSVSLWDCGEFIASAYKLQVGHPPGAPLFMIMARVFTLFAGGNVENVAFMVNAMSALASAFSILFLFWSITHLALKITGKDNLKPYQLVAVLGSGLVGALAYTFSDTFWFSAVEGEVYASSSLFTAIVFWAILKWENVANERYANRWLILIAYLMGLSIGVHLLNLLAIPAIVLVYYFARYRTTTKGVIVALGVGTIILGSVMYGIIPGAISLASKFELFFINTIGMPYNSGILIYLVLLFGSLAFGVYITHKKGKVIFNTILLALTVILIGYSSYSMIVIRSLANPPMDENSPETIFKLQSYLNREQYGDRPLMHGQYFNAPVTAYKEGKKYYTQQNGKYVVTNRKTEYEYDSKFTGLFPRMWSADGQHVNKYLEWGDIEEKDIYNPRRDADGKIAVDGNGKVVYDRASAKDKPSMGQNLRFSRRYQLNFMYLRYFHWNFIGRQNDVQGHGGIVNGNWISGIPFIDKVKEGDGGVIPEAVKNHKARNRYYGLPLILGLIGLLFHFQRHKKDAWIVTMLFVLTGIAIVIYLNQYPFQPRERDYAYAGSFYAFAIWIGLGVLGIIEMAGKALKSKPASIAVTVFCLLLVPGIMAKENWDDHDRSGRYTARDIAHNYLMSCAPNAILFTNGDNDTFPLWYAQEVEGIRTDVRIVNLMLLNMDWYADQMKMKAYESEPLPITLGHEKYRDGNRDIVFIYERYKKSFPAKEILEFIASDKKHTKVPTQSGKSFDFAPTRTYTVPVDSAKVIANGTVKPENAHLIEKELLGRFGGSRLTKSDLIAFDIIANNGWDRPIYFVSTGHSGLLGLDNYLQLDGFAYRLVPIKTTTPNVNGRIDTDILYSNLMEKFKWGRMNEDDVYLDHFNIRTFNVIRLRMRFNRLAEELIKEGKKDKAEKVLDKITELGPDDKLPYDFFVLGIAESYYKLEKFEKGNVILEQFIDKTIEQLNYDLSMSNRFVLTHFLEVENNFRIIWRLNQIATQYKQTELAEKTQACMDKHGTRFNDLNNIYRRK